MRPTLDDPLEKLRRAEDHLLVLREIGKPYLCPLTLEVESNGLAYSFYARDIPSIDRDIPLVIGDCLYCIRSALDQLIYQMHLRSMRGKLDFKTEREVMFPIIERRRTDKKTGRLIPTTEWNEIKRLSIRDRTAIEWIQPYQRRRDDMDWIRRTLGVINRLNIIDKHRRLHVVARVAQSVKVPKFPPECGLTETISRAPLTTGAQVVRWTFTNVPPDVSVDAEVEAHITLNEAGEYREILYTLGVMITCAGTVLMQFADRFPNSGLSRPIHWYETKKFDIHGNRVRWLYGWGLVGPNWRDRYPRNREPWATLDGPGTTDA